MHRAGVAVRALRDRLGPRRAAAGAATTSPRSTARSPPRRAATIDVLGLVVRTPGWAATDARQPVLGAAGPGRLRRVPADADRAATGPRGTFWAANPVAPRRPVRNWQIWNEPNIAINWDVQPWQRGYARLLRAAYPAVKGADPGATVVMAGLANFSWRDLERPTQGGGELRFDVAAVHPFSGRPSNSVKIIAPQPRGDGPQRRPPQADLADRADVVLGEGQEDAADAELGDDRGGPGRSGCAGLPPVRPRPLRAPARAHLLVHVGDGRPRLEELVRLLGPADAAARRAPRRQARAAAFRAVVRRYG